MWAGTVLQIQRCELQCEYENLPVSLDGFTRQMLTICGQKFSRYNAAIRMTRNDVILVVAARLVD